MPSCFADECVPRLIFEGLVERGLDVVDARAACAGDSDDVVLSLASASNRVVITEDWDFAEMTIRQRQPACGLIILSLFQLPAGRREHYAVEQIVKLRENAVGNLVVLEPGRVRTRPLPT